MKIVIVGASGVIGSHLARSFSTEHEVISASAAKSDYKVDMTSTNAIKKFFEEVGAFDALITVAGSAPMKPLEEMTHEDFQQGFNSKQMGQIDMVLLGLKHIRQGGSFTLVSGILAEDPIPNGVGLTVVNAALNGFVKAASRELLPQNIRINVVSPGLLEDSAERLGAYFPGHAAVPANKVIKAFEKSVLGNGTGEVIRVY